MAAPVPASRSSAGEKGGTFPSILVGIDETAESVVAAAQAGVLLEPGGSLVLLAIAERHLAVHAGLAAAHAEDDLLAGTRVALERAQQLVPDAEAMLVTGRLVERLCAECERRGSSLIAVGVRPHTRLTALTFGGHEVEALHDARCAILVARAGWGPSRPARIVVGVDRSPEAQEAEAVARALARRLSVEILPVIALDEGIDAELLRAEREDAVVEPGRLLEAVVAEADRRSLIVVGRARRGDRRFHGSFAERIVHAARCSVLVVQVPERP